MLRNDKSNARISVVIPAYNCESTIIEALDSVFNQTLPQSVLEVIVVNDGSSDETHHVTQEYIRNNPDRQIRLLTQENKGASAARNAGIQNARGDWIALLDSDDIWLKDKIEIQLAYISKNPKIELIGGNHQKSALKILFKRIDSPQQITLKNLCLKWHPVTPSIMFNKRLISRIGAYNESMHYAEDGDFIARACTNAFCLYIPEQIVEIGHGKRSYGERGLSKNLKGMYDGNRRIFTNLKRQGKISGVFYTFISVFAYIKYLRRCLITRIHA